MVSEYLFTVKVKKNGWIKPAIAVERCKAFDADQAVMYVDSYIRDLNSGSEDTTYALDELFVKVD